MLKLPVFAAWLVCALAVAMVTTGPASVTALPAAREKDGSASTDDTMAAQLAETNDDDAASDPTSPSMDDDYNAMAASSKEDADDVMDASYDGESDVATTEASTGRREPKLNTVHVSSLEPHKLFQLVRIGCSWHSARNWCRLHGMRLATPRSPFENLLVRLTCPRHHNCWLGVNDLHHEGRYADGDYRPLKFTNWYHGQPDNYHNEDCTKMMTFSGLWNDVPCHHHSYFVCSRV